MQHSLIYIRPSRFLSLVTASCAASFLAFFGAANGLAKPCYARRLGYYVPPSIQAQKILYYYYIDPQPSWYEAFPFLSSLRYTNSGAPNYIQRWFDYSAPFNNATGYYMPSWYYSAFDSALSAGNIPDDWTQDDIDNLINSSYLSLSDSERAALKGTIVAGVQGDSKFVQFLTKTPGTVSGNGVVTFDSDGNTIVAYPDNTGYISGYNLQPDGTTTPTYYKIEGNSVVEYPDITPLSYSSLSYDTNTTHYSLNVPDYSHHLDKIINKLDNINLQYDPSITVSPEITVQPDINVFATSHVQVTPQIILQITNNASTDSSMFETALFVDSDTPPLGLSTNDFALTSDEQTDVSKYTTWQTNIPLVGSGIDFGLTTLMGRIPSIGTEYTWFDHTIGETRTRDFVSGNPLQGFRIFISLDRYRDVILALRGWLILFEALYFMILTYRNVREALKV